MNKNKKGSVEIIALIVVVVALIVGGIWYFGSRGNNSNNVATNNTSGSMSTSTATSGPSTGTMGNPGSGVPPAPTWYTYRNATSGFAFQYPTNLNGKVATKSLPFNEISITVNGTRPSNTTNTTALPQLQITVSAKQASDTVQSDIIKVKNDPSQCAGSLVVSTTTVVGQQAALFVCTPYARLNLAPYGILDFYHNAQAFRIVVTNEPLSQDIAQEIADTFTFTK